MHATKKTKRKQTKKKRNVTHTLISEQLTCEQGHVQCAYIVLDKLHYCTNCTATCTIEMRKYCYYYYNIDGAELVGLQGRLIDLYINILFIYVNIQ